MNINPMEIEDYYFPVNLSQVETLLGKMLTHVEAMGLPSGVEKANKDLIRQSIWGWWSDAQENSMTSYKGCIGPIYSPSLVSASSEDNHVWFTDIGVTKPSNDAANVRVRQDKSGYTAESNNQ